MVETRRGRRWWRERREGRGGCKWCQKGRRKQKQSSVARRNVEG